MIRQRTLKNLIRAKGIGLHSGKKVCLTLRPAPEDTGVVFVRNDLSPPKMIKAEVGAVSNTNLSTCIEKDSVRVSTIEHLLSAFSGMGIDNVFVDLSAPEVPIMDGSASPFIFLIESAGIVEQNAPKRFIRVKSPVVVEENGKTAALKPYDGFRVSFNIDFPQPVFKNQRKFLSLDFGGSSFVKELSRARTFGFLNDIEQLRANNLALGGSFDNAVVVDTYRVLNPEGLRYEDEFIRHKMLDAIGDTFLLGYSLIGEYVGYKSGHALNNKLTRKLLDSPSAWEVVSFNNTEEAPLAYAKPAYS